MLSIGATVAPFAGRRRRLSDTVGAHLSGATAGASRVQQARRAEAAGLLWTPRQAVRRRLMTAGVGAMAGVMTGIATPVATPLSGMLIGAVVASMWLRVWMTNRTDRRSRLALQELPTVTDALALQVIAGESVGGAMAAVAGRADGVIASELARVTDHHRRGSGLPEALAAAAAVSAQPEAARLYGLLGHAHRTGGRMADALADLAADYRARIARDLTAEGGRRALAGYGPILALMVPVTLLFLMFPTLVGLEQLSSAP